MAGLHRSEERRVGKSVDLGGRRIIKKTFFQAEDGIRDIRLSDWSSDVCSSDLPEENQELSRYYDEIGYALLLQKDFDEAIKWLKKSHDICEDLYSKIETCESQRRLAENNLLFGIYYEKYGNLKKALEFYNQTAAITDKLVTVYGTEGLRKDAAYIKETIEFIKKKLGGR